MSGDQKGFADQLAIIAGAGLGRSYALDLAARGVRIVVNDVGHLPGGVSTAEDAVVEIRAAGSEAIASRRRWTPGAASTSSSTTPAFLRNGYCEDLTDDEIASVLDVHLAAAFHVTRPAWRVMKERGGS